MSAIPPTAPSRRAPAQINSLLGLSVALHEMDAAHLSDPVTSFDGLLRALNQLPLALPAVSVRKMSIFSSSQFCFSINRLYFPTLYYTLYLYSLCVFP